MKKTLLVIASSMLMLTLGLLAWPAARAARAGSKKFLRSAGALEGQYIVVLKPETEASLVGTTAQGLAGEYGGQVRYVFEHALKGYSVSMSEERAQLLSEDERVEFVEENGTVTADTTQFNPPWGLDRIDQPFRPLTSTYDYDNRGTGVKVYVIDTGIRPTHAEFAPGRAIAAADYAPPEFPDDPGGCAMLRPIICAEGVKPSEQDVTTLNTDCNGHGTHVAGTIGGLTYGVAKNARILGVRVLNCLGSGTYESVIAGVNWATAHHQANPGPAVANMSLGGAGNASLDTAVRNSIASGITYVVAAGNANANASGTSPARVSEAVTVGASNINDVRASFSNFGAGVDLHAPGVGVLSAWNTGDTATNVLDGTSMASPHVAGVAALYLQTFRTATPAAVQAALVGSSTFGVIGSLPSGTPNRLLYSRFFAVAVPPNATRTDFDGDAKADRAVWRPVDGFWHVINSLDNTSSSMQWGLAGDKIVPGDYDGDGKADRAVWRPSDGVWYIVNSTDGAQRFQHWGSAGDIPVAADYDGDGRTDLAVWRPSDGVWYILNSSTDAPRFQQWGLGSLGDRPVAADYDGDGLADPAVWRGPEGRWYVLNSSTGVPSYVDWGGESFGDVTVPADYDGDGLADVAVWRPGTGVWYILNSSTGTPRFEYWGMTGDVPVVADYDGDGKADVAVWRSSDGVWYVVNSSTGTPSYGILGQAGDIPIPSAYNRN